MYTLLWCFANHVALCLPQVEEMAKLLQAFAIFITSGVMYKQSMMSLRLLYDALLESLKPVYNTLLHNWPLSSCEPLDDRVYCIERVLRKWTWNFKEIIFTSMLNLNRFSRVHRKYISKGHPCFKIRHLNKNNIYSLYHNIRYYK